MAKGEYYDDAHIPSHLKKKEIIQRIHEWERFEANCQIIRELDNEKVLRISELQKKRRRSLENSTNGLEKRPDNPVLGNLSD